ncbi:MAG: hypothetical protein R2821_01755 [Flavobacteriaceae bacterium]
MIKYKSTGNKGLFDEQENIEKLSSIGNPLELINNVIDFEMFRNTLEVDSSCEIDLIEESENNESEK